MSYNLIKPYSIQTFDYAYAVRNVVMIVDHTLSPTLSPTLAQSHLAVNAAIAVTTVNRYP